MQSVHLVFVAVYTLKFAGVCSWLFTPCDGFSVSHSCPYCVNLVVVASRASCPVHFPAVGLLMFPHVPCLPCPLLVSFVFTEAGARALCNVVWWELGP